MLPVAFKVEDLNSDELLTCQCDDFIMTYDKTTKDLKFKAHKEINFDIQTEGNINFKCKNFNVVTEEKICFDSINNDDIHLNSKMAQQIKELPESISYREQQVEEMVVNWWSTVKQGLEFEPNYIEVMSMYKEYYKKLEIA